MGRVKCDHIKMLITLTSDNIKRLSLYMVYFQNLFKWWRDLHLLRTPSPRNSQRSGGCHEDGPKTASFGLGREKGRQDESAVGIFEERFNTNVAIIDKVRELKLIKLLVA